MADIARAAVGCERRYGLAAELIAAQCALESGWLKHAPGNNPFGIKWSPRRHERRQLLTTREWLTRAEAERFEADGRRLVRQESDYNGRGRALWVVHDWFAAYDTLDAAFDDYCRMVSRSPRYAAVASASDWREAVEMIGRSGYATDPGYADKLRAIMTPEFEAAINAERQTQAEPLHT